jgi:hypothetical protein
MIRNTFVDFINQFYSQHTAQSAGYAELSKDKLEGISLKVDGLIDDVLSEKINTVILTGNAGDGKTFICSLLYRRLTGNQFHNKIKLKEKTSRGWMLNMVKDASEVPAGELETFLLEMEKNLTKEKGKNRNIFILAGNEGKLSEVFYRFDLPQLQRLLDKSLRSIYEDENESLKEQANEWPDAAVLNFNWRDLTEENAFKSIIKAFVRDTMKWESVCNKCTNSRDCPIYLNARLLRDEYIIERIRTLFRFFRYIEGHFTLRELLSAISYILTAGLNCEQIKVKIGKRQQLNYMFYNNIFSRHDFEVQEPLILMDRILRGLQPLDVAAAPLAKVNTGIIPGIKELHKLPPPADSEESWRYWDLTFFKEKASKGDSFKRSLLDAFKRRIYFCIDKFWKWDFFELSLSEKLKILNIDHYRFLPFSGYKEFDDFLSTEIISGSEEYKNLKKTIIKGLNLLANRNDSAPDFWLKVYKPSVGHQSLIPELFGDAVETVEIDLTTKNPDYLPNYIEFANREFYFSARVEKDDTSPIRLPITIELYEGLRAAARGNQSKQGFGYLDRVIKEFRESLYYRTLEKIGSRKFQLNTPDKVDLRALEIFIESDRIMMKGYLDGR